MTKSGLAADGAPGPDYYDDIYDQAEHLKAHYSESPLREVYASAIRLLPKDKKTRILEIGCGTGQFAQNLHVEGYDAYRGFDFSPKALWLARRRGLPGRFQFGDARDPAVFAEEPYEVVVALEVLEHLDDDLSVLATLTPFSTVILSVPTKDSPGHVRYYSSEKDVRTYYQSSLVLQHVGKVHNWFLAKGLVP